jgi:hypothetical protein
MDQRPPYLVELENGLIGLLNRVVSRPRTSLLDPPVPLELIQTDLPKFTQHSSLHIEQAARSCVYRIAVAQTGFLANLEFNRREYTF